MANCPKCGSPVDDTMTFCPRCGAPLKDVGTQPSELRRDQWESRRNEKAEKQEKQEKDEKEEQEKGEFRFIGPMIGGLILVFLGVTSYLESIGYRISESVGAFFIMAIGIIIILTALLVMARRRNPRP